MKVIRFRTEGIFNSFRIPLFRTYHKSFLAPPKTTVLGMLTNIMTKPEKWFYMVMDQNLIEVSVVIDQIQGRAKDLWAYKTLESKGNMYGRSVIRRDRLYCASYSIYLRIKEEGLYEEVLEALRCPKNVPSLGLDDEMVRIYDVQEIVMETNNRNRINSVFMDNGVKYTVKIMDDREIVELPTAHIVPLKFAASKGSKGQREARKPMDEVKQVEYINCEIEVEGLESYTDGVNRVVFY